MRDFISRAPSVLRRMDVSARLVYTAFLVFLVVGLLTAALLHGDGMGTSADTAAAYWRGDEAQMTYPKSYRQLLELTHFHLFTEPVTFLVAAHLYNLSGDARARKLAACVATLAAMAVQIALPWLVTYAGAGWAMLLVPVHVVLVAGLLYMAGVSAWDMWAPSRSS
jgi:hypothetical protein